MAKNHSTLKALYEKFKGRCYYCFCKTWLHDYPEYINFPDQRATREHLIKKANGGKYGDNIVLACKMCNESRGDVPHDEWLKIRSKLREE